MASSKIKGITVEIGGDTTKLGKALDDSEKHSRSLQNELKDVNKLLKFDPNNTELLAQKQRILTEAVAETSKKLNTLKEAEAQVIAQFEKGDIGEDKLRAFQREIIATENSLDDLNAELKETTGSGQKVADSLDDAGDSADEAEGGFTIMKGALADLVANVVSGAISKIGDLVGALFELSEATEEYRTMQSKLAGSAETFGYSFDFANSKYEEFYKYLGDDQASTNAITNLMGIGAETDTVSKLAEGATAVWASYGDSIPIEGLTEAINETITVGKVTGGMADTINWAKNANEGLNSALSGNKEAQKAYNDAIKEGLPVEDAFNEALAKITDEQERADVVAKFLNDTYGESKKKYDELNGSVTEANEAELALKDTQAELGETMAPVNTALTNFKNEALEAITPLVKKLADAFLNLITWLKEHPAILQIVTALVVAMATAFGVLAGALAIQGLITGVTKAIALLNTTLLANPITLIVAAIAALVAAFIYLWNNCDGFREFWINLWEKIKSVFNTVCDVIVKFFTVTIPEAFKKFKDKVVEAFNTVKNFITVTIPEVISNVVKWFKELPGKIWSAILGTVDKVAQWGENVKAKASEMVKNAITAIITFFSELPYKIGHAIGTTVGTLITWGTNVINWCKTEVPKIISNIITFFKELPGKIYNAIVNTIDRIKTWGTNVANTAKQKATDMVNKVVTTAKALPGKIYSAITSTIDKVKTWGTNVANTAKTKISNMITSVVSTAKALPGKIYDAIKNAVNRVGEWCNNMKTKASDGIKKVVTTITDKLKEAPEKVKSIGKNIVEGIWNGIKNATAWIKQKVGEFAKGILDGMKESLGIKSPSRAFRDQVGKFIAEGIGVGITENENAPIEALEQVGEDMINSAQKINGITLNRQIESTFSGSVSPSADILNRLDTIVQKLETKAQIILDTGTLVGETVDAFDRALSNKKTLTARGVT